MPWLPQFIIKLNKVEPQDGTASYAEPTIEFSGTITNTANDNVQLFYSIFDIILRSSKGAASYMLGQSHLILHDIRKSAVQDFKFNFSFNIDSNNKIHDMIKYHQLSLNDDILFDLVLNGFCFYSNEDNGPMKVTRINTKEPIKSVSLYVGKYNSLLSNYYKDITWIPISRNIWQKLDKLKDQTGQTYEEIIEGCLGKTEP